MVGKRVDLNQSTIVDALRSVGATWISTSGDPNIGFDGIILWRSRVLIAEIKDESKPPSKRRLTPTELKRQQQCEAAGVPYLILLNPEQALRAVENGGIDGQ